MSIASYLFNKASKECVYLGKRGVRKDFEFEGPLFFLGENRYLLPVDLLELLIERFREAGSESDLVLVESDDLLDTEIYLSEDDELIEIGGEKYLDPPLAKYLPELDDESGRKNVLENGILVR